MIIEDIVLTVANIVLSIALLPQVYHGFKNKKGVIRLLTSAPTALSLYAIAGAFFSLSLYLSSFVTFIAASLWATLFFQRLIYKKNE